MKYVICYVSTAIPHLNDISLDRIMEKTLQYNSENGINGILLFSEGNFLQVLEGEKNILLRLYSKIEQDEAHKGIIKIVAKEINHGAYDKYMTCRIAKSDTYESPELLDGYMRTIKGMDFPVQNAVKNILKAFLKSK